MYDPQTSGGLLIALPEAKIERLLEELRKINHATPFSVVEKVKERSKIPIEVK